MHKVALVNSTTDALKKPRLRDRTDRVWFSRLLRHLARKRTESILQPRSRHRANWPRISYTDRLDHKTYSLCVCMYVWCM